MIEKIRFWLAWPEHIYDRELDTIVTVKVTKNFMYVHKNGKWEQWTRSGK